MAWTIRFEKAAAKELGKLDRQIAGRILRFLRERVATAEDPRGLGEALKGSTLGELWKYHVGDYRLICDIVDAEITAVVVRIGNCSGVYRLLANEAFPMAWKRLRP